MNRIRFLMLLITDVCNLNCSYCYKGQTAKCRVMPFELAESVLTKVGSSQSYFHVQLTGGEPTLFPEVLEKICKYLYQKSMAVSIGIQTNGTNIDAALIRLIKRFNIQLSISIDGPPEIQEVLRGKSEETFKNLKLLENYNVPFKVVSVITNKNIKFLDKLLLLLSTFSNFEGIALSLLVKKGRAIRTDVELPDLKEFEEGLKRFLETLNLINKIRKRKVSFREFETFKHRLKKGNNEPYCSALAGESLAVSPDGRLYPCSQTEGDSYFSLGTLEKSNFKGLHNLKKAANLCPEDCPSRTYYNNGKNKDYISIMRHLFKIFYT